MVNFLILVALPVVLLAVLASLVIGLLAMNKPGEGARVRSNVMMRWRVGLQVLALLIIILIVALR